MAAKNAIRTAIALGLAAFAASAMAVPDILIFRIQKAKRAAVGDFPICDALANQFQADGRLNPIVWDITDPIFREAMGKGAAPSGVEFPTLEQAEATASKMHVEYLLAIDLMPDANGMLASANLYKGSREVWLDPTYDLAPFEKMYKPLLKKKKMTQEEYEQALLRLSHRKVSVTFGNDYAVQSTLKSLAHSWVDQMNSDPLKGLIPAPITTTPDPNKGQQPTQPPVNPVPDRPAQDAQWEKDYQAAMLSEDQPKAVLILRDAVDSDPLDFKRRVAFVRALIAMGRPTEGANEARRGAMLMPDKVELRILAARAWMAAGNEEEAQADLNEALARAPDSKDTRLLLAEVSIAQDKPTDAVAHLDAILAKELLPDALFTRAMAHSMLGDKAKCRDDLAKASDLKLSQSPADLLNRYILIAPTWDHGIEKLSDEIRSLQQRALVQRTEAGVAEACTTLIDKVECRSLFLDAVVPPKKHGKSNQRRVLAYKLLSQCLLDLQSYLKTGEEDVLTESRINLGESLKQMASAKVAFKEESEAKKGNEKPTGT